LAVIKGKFEVHIDPKLKEGDTVKIKPDMVDMIWRSFLDYAMFKNGIVPFGFIVETVSTYIL